MTMDRAAQRWHDQQRKRHTDADEYGSCWCCCVVCDQSSPFASMAHEEMKREKAGDDPASGSGG